jgi:hypothetical protein
MDCLFQLSEEILMERADRVGNNWAPRLFVKAPPASRPQTATQAQTRNGDCVHLRR